MVDGPGTEGFQGRIVASFYGSQLRELVESFMAVDAPESATMADAINAMEPDETKRERVVLGLHIATFLVSNHINIDNVSQVLVRQKGSEATDIEYETIFHMPRR